MRPIVRIDRHTDTAVGHTSIAEQLEWCARAGVQGAILTHCGRAIVAGPPRIEQRIAELGRSHHVDVATAEDGLRVRV